MQDGTFWAQEWVAGSEQTGKRVALVLPACASSVIRSLCLSSATRDCQWVGLSSALLCCGLIRRVGCRSLSRLVAGQTIRFCHDFGYRRELNAQPFTLWSNADVALSLVPRSVPLAGSFGLLRASRGLRCATITIAKKENSLAASSAIAHDDSKIHSKPVPFIPFMPRPMTRSQ